jgi:hypothetical protein
MSRLHSTPITSCPTEVRGLGRGLVTLRRTPRNARLLLLIGSQQQCAPVRAGGRRAHDAAARPPASTAAQQLPTARSRAQRGVCSLPGRIMRAQGMFAAYPPWRRAEKHPAVAAFEVGVGEPGCLACHLSTTPVCGNIYKCISLSMPGRNGRTIAGSSAHPSPGRMRARTSKRCKGQRLSGLTLAFGGAWPFPKAVCTCTCAHVVTPNPPSRSNMHAQTPTHKAALPRWRRLQQPRPRSSSLLWRALVGGSMVWLARGIPVFETLTLYLRVEALQTRPVAFATRVNKASALSSNTRRACLGADPRGDVGVAPCV